MSLRHVTEVLFVYAGKGSDSDPANISPQSCGAMLAFVGGLESGPFDQPPHHAQCFDAIGNDWESTLL